MTALNKFSTTHQIDYSWDYFLSSEAGRRDGDKDSRYFGFLQEPEKYLCHEESTYRDHYGPKTNFPTKLSIDIEGPISTAYTSHRSKHLVSTTQYDYDGRRNGTFTGSSLAKQDCDCYRDNVKGDRKKGDPEELLTTIGAVPLVKRCRNMQNWVTTYQRDFLYDPIQRPAFPLP